MASYKFEFNKNAMIPTIQTKEIQTTKTLPSHMGTPIFPTIKKTGRKLLSQYNKLNPLFSPAYLDLKNLMWSRHLCR